MKEKNTEKLVQYFSEKIVEFSTNNRHKLNSNEAEEMIQVWEDIKSGKFSTQLEVDVQLKTLTDKWSKGKSILNYINDYYQDRRD